MIDKIAVQLIETLIEDMTTSSSPRWKDFIVMLLIS